MNFFRPGLATKIFLLVVLSFFLYFWGLGNHGLLEPDEGRYSEIPREMRESGDFVTPKLNYIKYFEKPVLHYWLTAGAYAVFGENEFAARFWPALLALGGAAATFFLAKYMFRKDVALLSSVILVTSLLYFTIGQINITDMPLSFFLTIAMVGFWCGLEKGRRYYMFFYAGMAFAVLTKGLVGIVLPGGIIFWYMILTRRWDIIRSTLYLPGILLFFALTSPWFITVCLRNNGFFHFFFIQEHFLRYTTKMHGRYEPAWFFIPILVLGFFPWTGLLPRALRLVIPSSLRSAGKEKKEELFLFLWLVVIFFFFSLSNSKMVPYIIPAFPPLAILMGRGFYQITAEEKDGKGVRQFLIWNSIFLVPFISALLTYPFFNDQLPATLLLPYTFPVAVTFSAFLATGWYFFRRKNFRIMGLLLCLIAFTNMFAFKRGFILYDKLLSARELAGIVSKLRCDGDVIAQFSSFDQGLPFYLKQRIVLVNYLGELEFGAKQEKDPFWFIGDKQLQDLWKGKHRVILVIKKNHLKRVTAMLDPPLSAIAGKTNKRFVLVNRP